MICYDALTTINVKHESVCNHLSNRKMLLNARSKRCWSFFVQLWSMLDENDNVFDVNRSLREIASFVKQSIEILCVFDVKKRRDIVNHISNVLMRHEQHQKFLFECFYILCSIWMRSFWKFDMNELRLFNLIVACVSHDLLTYLFHKTRTRRRCCRIFIVQIMLVSMHNILCQRCERSQNSLQKRHRRVFLNKRFKDEGEDEELKRAKQIAIVEDEVNFHIIENVELKSKRRSVENVDINDKSLFAIMLEALTTSAIQNSHRATFFFFFFHIWFAYMTTQFVMSLIWSFVRMSRLTTLKSIVCNDLTTASSTSKDARLSFCLTCLLTNMLINDKNEHVWIEWMTFKVRSSQEMW